MIEAHENDPDRPYVRSVRLNGRTLNTPFLDIATLKKGAELIFNMASEPAHSALQP